MKVTGGMHLGHQGGRRQNRRALGAEKERLAAEYLAGLGYEILGKNFYSHFGELDIIAREGCCLVFCEVKYRSGTAQGYPEEAVTAAKLLKMRRTAEYYCLCAHTPPDTPCRFDVVSILGGEIRHYRNVTGM